MRLEKILFITSLSVFQTFFTFYEKESAINQEKYQLIRGKKINFENHTLFFGFVNKNDNPV